MGAAKWQKRGLPHAHLLIWLCTKINATAIDRIISAEIPDPKLNKDLHMRVYLGS